GSGVIRLNYRAADNVGSQAGVSCQFTSSVNLNTHKKSESTARPGENDSMELNNASGESSSLQETPMKEMKVQEALVKEDRNLVPAKQLDPNVVETPVAPPTIPPCNMNSVTLTSNPSDPVSVANPSQIDQNPKVPTTNINIQEDSQNEIEDDDPMDGSSEQGLQYATEGQIFIVSLLCITLLLCYC
ncbi:unnamed protein product, partial [Allacma fusca]